MYNAQDLVPAIGQFTLTMELQIYQVNYLPFSSHFQTLLPLQVILSQRGYGSQFYISSKTVFLLIYQHFKIDAY